MPHVKGNKFKPKLAGPAAGELRAGDPANSSEPSQKGGKKKGNKFKPKLGDTPASEPQAAQAAGTGVPGGEQQQQAGGKRNKKKLKKQQAAAGAATDVAVEPSAPGAAVVAGAALVKDGATPAAAKDGAGPPPSKKQRRQQQQQTQQQQQQQASLPAIPTVLAPLPKPGAPPPATSNWTALKAVIDAAKQQQEASRPHWQQKKRKAADAAAAAGAAAHGGVQSAVPANRPQSIGGDTAPTKVVAVDCEMVGVGAGGQRSALARVCVVNSAGNVLLDRFVRPNEKVTDFRTKVSGVRPANLREAAAFDEVQKQVSELLKGRIVVGHAIENDLEALLLSHGRKDVRDTSRYPPLMNAQGRTGKLKPRALRHLASEQLGLAIQEGEHSPVDDARAALYLYLKHRKEWERWVQAGGRQHQHPAVAMMAAAGLGLAAGSSGGRGRSAQVQLSVAAISKADYMADL